jgi:hypothetical protein
MLGRSGSFGQPTPLMQRGFRPAIPSTVNRARQPPRIRPGEWTIQDLVPNNFPEFVT